jgi:hypothetical protein
MNFQYPNQVIDSIIFRILQQDADMSAESGEPTDY